MSLPTLVYKSPGPYDGTPIDGKSTSYDCLGVKTEDELAAALADGWSARLVDALTKADEPSPIVAAVLEAAENDEPIKAFLTIDHVGAAPVLVYAPVDVDLKTLSTDDLKAIAKDLDGYDGRLGREKLIALIEKARA